MSIIKEALMKKCNLIQNQPLPCQIFKEPLNPRINEQLLMFYPLGKIPEKPKGGRGRVAVLNKTLSFFKAKIKTL